MKLWLISQTDNNDYDTYDSAVVAAETEDEARSINPGGRWSEGPCWTGWASSPEKVRVEYLGTTDRELEPGIILASFNAG